MSIYDFKIKAQDGSEVALSDYKGKVLLIVNTATVCGFTPQYDELQDLYELHYEGESLHRRRHDEADDLPRRQRLGAAFAVRRGE